MSASLTGIANPRLVAPLTVAIAAAALAAANFSGNGENGGAGPYAVSLAIAVLVTALMFGRVVPRALEGPRPARIALVIAGLSVLTCVAFWSGLPQALAPAAIVLGLASPRSGESVAATGIASVAYVASLVGCVIG